MTAGAWRNSVRGSCFAGLLMVCAADLQAVEIPVMNGSFEEPYLFEVMGCPACGQPTSAQDPSGWNVITQTGTADTIALDGRWQPDWAGLTAGPTDGLQALLLDNRNPQSDGDMRQDLGTLADLGIGSGSGANRVVMTFDARFGEYNRAPNTGNANEDSNIDLFAYFTVNGVRDTANQFHSNMGPGNRLIPAWTELDPAPPAPPDAQQDNGHPDNMGHYSFQMPLTGLADSDVIGIGIQYVATNQSGCCDSRTYIDNVRVETDAALAELVITGIEKSGSVITLSWQSRPGLVYVVDYSFDLSNWPDVNDNVPSQGQTTTTDVDISSDITQEVGNRIFFRVREQ